MSRESSHRLTSNLCIGCINCRTRRIKCDEKQPACGRCSSLGLPCHKPEPPIPLKIRRRGHGPVKSRHILRWEPPKILPNLQQNTPDHQPASSAVKPNSVSIRQIDGLADLDIMSSTADITNGVRSLECMEPVSWSSDMDVAITSPGIDSSTGPLQSTSILQLSMNSQGGFRWRGWNYRCQW